MTSPVNIRERTPSLLETIEAIISKELYELHTSLPGQIISYDPESNLAEIQPTLNRKFKNLESSVKLPIITNVPVMFQRIGPAHLRFPVNEGDTGQLFFMERSIDGWLQSGGCIDPEDPRRHALSDASFFPGLSPLNNPMESSAADTSIELKLKNSYIEITEDGRFKLTNDVEELFDLLVQTLTAMIEEMRQQGEIDTTNTIFGARQPNNFAAYTTLKTTYDELKTKLESLKG